MTWKGVGLKMAKCTDPFMGPFAQDGYFLNMSFFEKRGSLYLPRYISKCSQKICGCEPKKVKISLKRDEEDDE